MEAGAENRQKLRIFAKFFYAIIANKQSRRPKRRALSILNKTKACKKSERPAGRRVNETGKPETRLWRLLPNWD
ncbi:MAG: hypothetical protein RMM53_07840 [Bacteroidia bacterium]|nr:hypothetical protein [Bacteroidia bacterium]